MKRLKYFLINITLVLSSVLFGIFLVEFGARLYFFGSFNPLQTEAYGSFRQPTEKFGWRLMPDIDVWLRRLDYSVRYRTNSHGFHDIERNYEKPEDTFRIVVLGDSFMESYVVNYKDSFSALLESHLGKSLNRDIEVINLGIGGYGTVQQYLMQVMEADEYDPDMILLAFLIGNDIRNNSRDLEQAIWGPNSLKVKGRPYIDSWGSDSPPQLDYPDPAYIHDQLERFNGVRERKDKWYEGLIIKYYFDRFQASLQDQDHKIRHDPNVLLGPYLKEFNGELGQGMGRNDYTTKEWEEMWRESTKTTYDMIHTMQRHSHEKNQDFCVFAIPSRIALEKDKQKAVKQQFPGLALDFDAPHSQFKQKMSTLETCHIDLLQHFKDIYASGDGPLYNQIVDSHWNVKGYQAASQAVADFLSKRVGHD